MSNAPGDKDSVKTSWMHIQVSAPIIVFIALPIIFLTFACIHQFKNDFVTISLLVLTSFVTAIFLILGIFKPENLTLDGRGHLAIKRAESKKNSGGIVK